MSRVLGPSLRSFDFETRSSDDGRTMEGYVAVFNHPTRIPDRAGDFDEEIHPGFARRYLSERGMPVMQYDHGKDPRVGTVPIGVYDVFEPDKRGYFVRGRLLDNAVVEPVRQAIASGAIKGMSFRFLVPPGGDKWSRGSDGRDKRDVFDADIPEAGPVVFPAYAATSVSVRTLLAAYSDEERAELIRQLAEEAAVDLTTLTGYRNARSVDSGNPGVAPGEGNAPVNTHGGRAKALRRLPSR
jgi:HK97 family phage prohead protease